MRTLLALIITPSIALGIQSVLYALVTPSCAAQSRVWLHLSAAAALLVSVVLAALAWSEWFSYAATLRGTPDSVAGDPRSTRRFLAAAATGVAVLSCLVILMMWSGTWVLSPCSEQ
ncbi:hypothetical protein [Ramlibacter albus]|uniref:Uncharacterized protein n=1 Tax=Ramlibacter albus TaxID=2079448 RepID=A0A923M6E5_9BURK|nr:hypothetical protein [Ramlibacter albus]MBC5764688.1 hypothetical protein [Ramlibacter albus]